MNVRTLFLMAMLAMTHIGCSTKYIQGTDALQACYFFPVESWSTQNPTSLLCIIEPFNTVQFETILIHVPNRPKIFKKGRKIPFPKEFLSTCTFLAQYSQEDREKLLRTMSENNMKIPTSKYTYELWTEVDILSNGNTFVEVIRSGPEAWIRTATCSQS